MLFSALAQAPKLTTVFSVVRSHACNPFARRGFRNLGVYGFAFPKSMQRLRPQSTPLCQRGIHGRSALEIEELYNGNKAYIAKMSEMNPGLLQSLAHNGQNPSFMIVSCSDSRVNEQGIFSTEPGTMFTTRNIANQFDEEDPNSHAVLCCTVELLKVKHVIVMGHYGCAGVAASMVAPPPQSANLAFQNWIYPIRQIYETSKRPEIAGHRAKYANGRSDTPGLHDPAFRALVEENVKANVTKIANSAVLQRHYATNTEPVTEIYIHGWVYDMENGQVSDIGVSVGPPGKVVPPSPFPELA